MTGRRPPSRPGAVAVERVDPADPDSFAEWFGVVDASVSWRWPGRPGWQPAELRAKARGDPSGRAVLLLGRLGGDPAGAALVELHDADNRHLAEVMLEVDPARRHRGVGSAVLAEAESLAVADGRRTVTAGEEVVSSAPSEAGSAFATAHGYTMVLENLRRELAVPLDRARAEGLTAEARSRAEGYEVVTFTDRWPEEWLDERAVFARHMSTDAPLGGMAMEPERWGPARVRSTEELVAAMGRRLIVAVAVAPAGGRPVAFSELTVAPAAPGIAWQWDTLVMPAHRGHRLGLLVKLANLANLASTSPGTSTVVTWNARSNDPMIAVNEALGCRVTAVGRTWQRHLG